MKLVLLLLVAAIVPGGSILAAVLWRRQRTLAREATTLDRQLIARRERLNDTLKGQTHDESLEMRARARREIADSIRKRSAMVASGSSSASVLKMVKKA